MYWTSQKLALNLDGESQFKASCERMHGISEAPKHRWKDKSWRSETSLVVSQHHRGRLFWYLMVRIKEARRKRLRILKDSHRIVGADVAAFQGGWGLLSEKHSDNSPDFFGAGRESKPNAGQAKR